ncbi:MAG TPA: 2OG-Fe(II) oxygenase [Lysobacter sp.]
MDALLDLQRLRARDLEPAATPFPLLVVDGLLPQAAQASLEADFPRYAGAGFFPYVEADCGPSMRSLVGQMTSPGFGDAIGRRLGIEGLGTKPALATLCRSLNRRHGTIHTDSRSKIATALLYLNADRPAGSDGCLRFLARIDDIDSLVVPEVRPLYGTLAAFRRTGRSFHGHLPFEGERRVVQVAWLTSEDEKLRKARRGGFSRGLKRLLGSLDRRLGAGRDRHASHPD